MRTVSHYRLLQKLGEGGMGEVWLADDLHLHRKVALKLISGLGSADEGRKKRFTREARAAAALSHPNICVVYEAAEADDGIPFISMEYVEGETLQQAMRRSLPLEQVLQIGVDIAEALAAAHSKEVIHRDIKPGNVVLTPDGRTKVLDFGLARLNSGEGADEEGTDLRTATGVIMGTASYMSPEQAQGLPVDHRTDIFSLGVVLYEMATAKRPFDGTSRLDTLRRVSECKPQPPVSLNSRIPASLDAIIRTCLDRDPARRYASAAELSADLRAVGAGRPLPEESTATVIQISRKRFIIPALVGVTLLIAAAISLVLFRSRQPEQPAHVPPAAAAPQKIRVVAVMPLTGISRESDSEYFSDGVTEEIINGLGELQDLRVISRTSSFAFKGAREDVRQIGKKLGADAVVEGSVRSSGDEVRISVRLTSVADGIQLWSETYDRHLKDIFAVQQEIARAVATALDAKLRAAVHGEQRLPVDADTYRLYLKGRYFMNTMQPADVEKSVSIFREVIRREPSWAPVWASLADTYLWLDHLETMAPKEAYEMGLAAARKALEIDPDSGEAQAALAHALAHDGDLSVALAAAQRSVKLAPSSAMAAQWHGLILRQLFLPGAAEELDRAAALDPLSIQTVSFVGLQFLYYGDYRRAMRYTQAALELAPGRFARDLVYLAKEQALLGQHQEALQTTHLASRLATDSRQRSTAEALRASILATGGNAADARAILRRLDVSGDTSDYFLQRMIFEAYAALGDVDRAMDAADRVLSANPRTGRLNLSLPPHPMFDRTRYGARYLAMRRRLGLPPPPPRSGSAPSPVS